jgi:hypothetical protein
MVKIFWFELSPSNDTEKPFTMGISSEDNSITEKDYDDTLLLEGISNGSLLLPQKIYCCTVIPRHLLSKDNDIQTCCNCDCEREEYNRKRLTTPKLGTVPFPKQDKKRTECQIRDPNHDAHSAKFN